MADPTSIGVKVGIALVDKAVESGLIDKIIDAFKKKHRVLILGSSGVGKTNLINSLTKETTAAVNRLSRTEVVSRSRIRINKKPFVFTDTPGQQHHDSRRLKGIRQEMGHGKVAILNVVAYGFHEGPGAKTDAIDPDGNPKPDFLDRCRALEIAAIKEWVPLLGDPQTTAWFITVVNKADLWWHMREKVMKHYVSGAYADALGEAKSLHPIVVPYSATTHKFFGEGALSGAFDREDQMQTKSALLSTIVAAVADSED